MKRLFSIALFFISTCAFAQAPHPVEPLRLGMVDFVHGHAGGFLNRDLKRPDIRLVGIAESDQAVGSRYAERYRFDRALLFSDMDRMLDQARPQAVVILTSTFDHLRVVEACAARGIPAMI